MKLEIVPGHLDIDFVHGNDISFRCELKGQNLSGSSFHAAVRCRGGLIPMTATVRDGGVDVRLAADEAKRIPMTGEKTWALVWEKGFSNRTLLWGKVNLIWPK
jgi:hypothetical protein